MRQTKLESIIEACINTGSGFIIALTLTAIFSYLPNSVLYLGDGLTNGEIFMWTVLMTAVSILRSYVWRRFFANEIHKGVHEWVRGLINEPNEKTDS